MIESIFGLLGAALKLWETKEKRKYLDEYLSLKKDWNEEYNKDPSNRSDLALDRIAMRLRDLSRIVVDGIGKQDS
jgi:hypothetical protein